LSDTSTRTGFDEQALLELPKAPAPFVDRIRAQALEEFLALPVPSQETEEWRYTDLSGFDFGFTPWASGGRASNLDGVPPEILQAAGTVGDRAGLQIQRNSEVMVTHLDPDLSQQGPRRRFRRDALRADLLLEGRGLERPPHRVTGRRQPATGVRLPDHYKPILPDE